MSGQVKGQTPAHGRNLTRAKQLRLDRNLSVAQLSALSGVNRQTIYDLERGGINPHVRTLSRLARVLKVSPSSLLLPAVYPDPEKAA